MKAEPYDLIINGGGLVGASLACALASHGFRIALIEASAYDSKNQPSFDTRALALTYSSGTIFRNLNVWQGLDESEATAIRYIDVSDAAAGGLVRLRSEDVGRQALGWNVEAQALGKQIFRVLGEFENIDLLSPMRLQDLSFTESGILATVRENRGASVQSLSASLLVVADGSNSALRDELNFSAYRAEYRQSAVVCRVESDAPNRGGAYEHFTRSGPLALLPIGERGYSVVWTQEQDELKRTMQLSRSAFVESLQNEIGERPYKLRNLVGERKIYPLTLSHLKKFVRPRVVVVGNASHTVHPVAGQGFNLALRDVAALAQVLSTHRRRGWDIGSYDVLIRYERWRSRESNQVTGFTDSMIRIFANELPVLTPARSWVLDLLQTAPPVKRMLLMRTMGLYGKQPDLASEVQ